MSNWTRASVGLATFGFINLILFIILSSPITTIFDLVEEQANESGVGSDVSPMITMWRTTFGVVFVLSFVGLIIWFLLGTHEEEGEEY